MTMTDIFDNELFTPPGTFMGVDYGHDLAGRRAAILGITYDNGTHPHRVGAREGPRAIREASRLSTSARTPTCSPLSMPGTRKNIPAIVNWLRAWPIMSSPSACR